MTVVDNILGTWQRVGFLVLVLNALNILVVLNVPTIVPWQVPTPLTVSR